MSAVESSQPKRGVVSARRRRALLLLVAAYQRLQLEFPELRHEIQSDIDDLVEKSVRTREMDRQTVIAALAEWESVGLTVGEIMNDTGLSERTVRTVIDELQKADPPGVRFYKRPVDGGRPTTVFDLIVSN